MTIHNHIPLTLCPNMILNWHNHHRGWYRFILIIIIIKIAYISHYIKIGSINIIMIEDSPGWYQPWESSITYTSPCVKIVCSINIIIIEDDPGQYQPLPSSVAYLPSYIKIGSSINVITFEDGPGRYWSGGSSIMITLFEDPILKVSEG